MDRRSLDEREVQQLWDSVRAEALRRGADAHTAEDVAQEAWLRAVRKPPEERGRLRGWLHVVAVRLLRETRSRAGNRSRRELAAARAERTPSNDAAETTAVMRYLEELDEAHQVVIRLRFFEDLEVDEIAARLGLHPEAVRSRLKRGLARLRARIEPEPQRGRLRAALTWIGRLLRRTAGGEGSAVRRVAAAALAGVACLTGWFLWTSLRPARAPLSGTALAAAPASVPLQSQPVLRERAPTPHAPEAPVPAAAPGSHDLRLAGLVLTPSGEPVPFARVHSASAADLADEVVVVADEHGRYEIPANRHDLVWATHADWCDSRLCYVLSLVDPRRPERTDEAPERLDLHLSPTRGRASVVVVGAGGMPVAQARVQLNPGESSDQVSSPRGTLEFVGPPATVTTDAGGRVELSFPDRAWVNVLVEADGYPAWLEQRRTPEPGGELAITLPAPASVTGKCVADGSPCRNARVEVLQLGGLVRREAWTDHDGSYLLEALMPGEFVVRAGEDPLSGPRSARHEGVLGPGESAELRLELDERTSIHGVLLDPAGTPVAGMKVSLSPSLTTKTNHTAEGLAPRDTRTDEHGLFAFAGCRLDTPQRLRALPGGAAVGPEQTVLPGEGEVVLELETEAARLAPIELAFLGEAVDLPRFVELRIEPSFSLVLESLSDPRRFRSPLLRKGRYMVATWSPESGAWYPGSIEHDPLAPRVHELPLPRPGWLVVELELPPGVSREDAEVIVLAESFNTDGLGTLGRQRAERPLVWDPASETYSCELRPGEHPLVIRAPGMAQMFEPFRIEGGEETRLRFEGVPGIEVPIRFRSPRYLTLNEFLHMDVLTPRGTTRIDLRWRNQRVVPGGFAFLVWLPAATIELTVSTEPVLGGEPLAGGRAVAPRDLLDPLEVDLVPTPK